jgi:hypothetical protein
LLGRCMLGFSLMRIAGNRPAQLPAAGVLSQGGRKSCFHTRANRCDWRCAICTHAWMRVAGATCRMMSGILDTYAVLVAVIHVEIGTVYRARFVGCPSSVAAKAFPSPREQRRKRDGSDYSIFRLLLLLLLYEYMRCFVHTLDMVRLPCK